MNYQDTLDHLHAQLQEHGKVALERFARKVITALETQVRDEEVAQELTIEQPHYRRLRLLRFPRRCLRLRPPPHRRFPGHRFSRRLSRFQSPHCFPRSPRVPYRCLLPVLPHCLKLFDQ